MSSRKLDEFVSSWTMETVSQCLSYCRDWNTNAKKAIVVHALLGSILRCVGIASLKEMPASQDVMGGRGEGTEKPRLPLVRPRTFFAVFVFLLYMGVKYILRRFETMYNVKDRYHPLAAVR